MTILHLEDSDNDAFLMEGALRGKWPDCRVRRAGTRAEFLAALQRGDFDLVICDQSLPGFDGLTALAETRKRWPDKPVIFFSGTIGEERAIEILKQGAVDYVLKDRPARLVPAIQQALARVEEASRRRQAEKALRENQEKLREQAALLDKARDAIIATDLEHRITYWNASAERIYGWRPEEAVGCDLRKLGLEYELAAFAVAHSHLLATGEWHGEWPLTARNGTKLHVATTWSLVHNSAGRPSGVLLIDTDITKAKQLELHLLRVQRAESIGTLAGGVAHDLNNLLTPLMLGIGLLRMESLGPVALKIVESLEASAKHGSALVGQLLCFARGSDGERQPIQLQAIMHEVVYLLRQTFPRRIAVQIEISGEPRSVMADATQLKQLLLNLCLNARDAIAGEGSITLAVEEVSFDEEGARAFVEARSGRYLHLRVADTGAGIRPEFLDHIFDPFFTTKSAAQGTGLGLSVVRGIVKGHRGFLQVESVLGTGSTFHIYLPAPEAELTILTPDSVPADDATARTSGR